MDNKFDYKSFRFRTQLSASKINMRWTDLMDSIAPKEEWIKWFKGTGEPSEKEISALCEKLQCTPEELFTPITINSSPEIIESLERVQNIQSKPKGRPPKEKPSNPEKFDAPAGLSEIEDPPIEVDDENIGIPASEIKSKRHRRTKAEMQAAREQEAKEKKSALLKASALDDNNNANASTVNKESNLLSDPVKVDEDVSDKTETLSTTKTDNTVSEDKDTNTNDNQSAFNATDSKTPEDIVFARTNVGMSYLVKADVVKPKRHRRTKAEMEALRADAEKIKREKQAADLQVNNDDNNAEISSINDAPISHNIPDPVTSENEIGSFSVSENTLEPDGFNEDASDDSNVNKRRCNAREYNAAFAEVEHMLVEATDLKDKYDAKNKQVEQMMENVRDVTNRLARLEESTRNNENWKLFFAISALDEESKKIVFDLVKKLRKSTNSAIE